MAPSVHEASRNKQLAEVRSLVNGDPKLINAVDADGRTPLHWAASSGSFEIASFLIDKNAKVDEPDNSGWTPLHIAVSAGREDIVRYLVGAYANVNATNDKGLTPLHYAASKSHIDIGKFLIKQGANINALDKAKQHPLHRSATTGSTGFISMLLKPTEAPEGTPKTRLNTADRIGNTPLHLAMESAHAEAAVLLIEAGADRSRMNQEQETPEDMQGVGGVEQTRARQYVIERCGKA